MIDSSELAELFDGLARTLDTQEVSTLSRPTDSSIAYIEERLRCRLPRSLLEFIRLSNTYARWFLSFGEDYTNPCHVLKVQSLTASIRRRKKGKWQYIRPRNIIPITIGYDGDYTCIDIARPGTVLGEFEICYWSTPMTEAVDYEVDFTSYLLKMILSWSNHKHSLIHQRALVLLDEHQKFMSV